MVGNHLKDDELGSEVIQLALTLPLLLMLFGIAAQSAIWIFSAIQFTNAAESVSYEIDLEKVLMYGPESTAASTLIANKISERMIGIGNETISVSNVLVTSTATARSAPIATNRSTSDTSTLVSSETTGTLAFTASYRCPVLLGIGEPLVIEHRWTRERLITRRTEIG